MEIMDETEPRFGDVITFADADGVVHSIRVGGRGVQTRSGGGVTTTTRDISGYEVDGPHKGQRGTWPAEAIAEWTVTESAEDFRARWHAEVDAAEAIAADAAGSAWPYGLRLESEAFRPGIVRWTAVGPRAAHAIVRVAPSEEPPAVDLYDRAMYERACRAVDIEPWADNAPGFGTGNVPGCDREPSYPTRTYLEFTLAAMRWRGLRYERADGVARRHVDLERAGLHDGPLTRARYEQACQVMRVAPLPDQHCLILDNELAALRVGASFTTIAGLPREGPAAELAVRRAEELIRTAPPVEMRTCDECGTEFPKGTGMIASMGLACDVPCFDAMADRPGRHASRAGRRG